jgi:hypothetical protein
MKSLPERNFLFPAVLSVGGDRAMLRVMMFAVVLSWAMGWQAAPAQAIDVTGAWDVTFTMPNRQATGLAILSQDGANITGMIGPAVTDMMPLEGTASGTTVTLVTRPRTGRTAAFTKCEMVVDGDRMTGTIDGDQGKIELVRKKRAN